ncbi:3',5'-cyclic AMP phosphodiesterase CpdA [Poseidonocella pacifica]|uniref:3',5'-cyclic AMP phosphodiesterase CpdA n=1 Tax=Poseidonocella pacifica TaxID=871651 RepID=A0A1I0YCH6_9RHOB|nr:metallophosphoesterase [Poseidonocella pacifica]SFB11024.1 3',5'-cyclic AMP phosphodiesterase CpdA [Poseidonocella pacifica]
MIRITQISDLHFGRDDPTLEETLIDAVNASRPDLVVVSGDFVQRARWSHFREARAFMERIEAPTLSVPGNHDLPLWNLPLRLVAPKRRYQRYIARDLEPVIRLGGVTVVGVDTTYRWHWQSGRISAEQIDRVADIIGDRGPDDVVVVVAHHPFHHSPEVEKKLMRGAPKALRRWGRAGPHVILSGHLHTWLTEPFVARRGDAQTLQVHAGTGLSTRLRGEPNDFAVLEIAGPEVRIIRHTAGADREFREADEVVFRCGDGGWVADGPAAVPRECVSDTR